MRESSLCRAKKERKENPRGNGLISREGSMRGRRVEGRLQLELGDGLAMKGRDESHHRTYSLVGGRRARERAN